MTVAKEVATKDVSDWLDFMDAPAAAREHEHIKPFVESLVNSVSLGLLVINEDKSVTQHLKFPLAEGATRAISYSFRFTVGEYQEQLKGVPEIDEVPYVLAKLRLLSKLAPEVLRRLDHRDYKVAKALTVFF